MSKQMIVVDDIKKSYGKQDVLKGVSFNVEKGSIVALLGPNGAGKTTTVRILSTLLKFDGGNASIDGFDLRGQADKVRETIGLTGQYAAVDELLTGRENLIMMGRLYRLTSDSAKFRAQELLEEFDLTDAADRPAKTYSGGMRRRLDLAVSLIATPPVIFLDEPTTGLDPRSRMAMWDIINGLVEKGTTILLTTQYLEEADQLASKIVVIDHGVVIAEGTSAELKKKIGNDRLEVTFANKSTMNSAEKILGKAVLEIDDDTNTVSTIIHDNNKDVKNVLDTLSAKKIKIESISIRKPTLDDVFLSITGKTKSVDEGSKESKNV